MKGKRNEREKGKHGGKGPDGRVTIGIKHDGEGYSGGGGC
jgi:hypothetical protein